MTSLSNTLVHQAGTASAPPELWASGALLTTPVAGAVEFLTDKWYATISTGAARKELALIDAALTAGRRAVRNNEWQASR